MHRPRRDRLILGVALLCSGAAALVYESAWGRMLQRVFGVSDWAVATVLAAFFLGMGIGSALGGAVASRIERPTRAYAALELGVGAWALLSLFAMPRIHLAYASLGPDASFAVLSAARFALAMLILLPPTIGMGATLPILVRRFEAEESFRRDATLLYGLNTVGAALGAGATGFVMLPMLGVQGSVCVAAALSATAAVVALVGLGGGRVTGGPEAPLTEETSGEPYLELEPTLVLGLAALSGLVSLAGEVLFTRLLRIVIQGTSQAFAAMLVCYLVGIAGGSAIAGRIGRTPALALARFGGAQLVASALVAIGIGTAPWLPRLVGIFRGHAELIPHETGVILAIAVLALLPIALAVGTGLPLVVALIDRGGGATRVGKVLAANTIGGLVGSLLAGFLAVPAVGLEASLYGLCLLHAVLALTALLTAAGSDLSARLTALVATAAVVTATFVLRPSIDLPFLLDAWSDASRAVVEGPAGYDRTQLKFLREGRNTTVSVVDRDGTLRLFNDGRPESGITAGTPAFGPELVMLGGLPGMLSGRRERSMVIGLGAGHSATMLLASDFARVDVVELEPAVVEAARTIHRMRGHRFPLDDARAHLVIDDARARLALARAGSYDAIVSQPSHPWLSGVSALYTREFFLEANRALRADGVLSLWVNVFRMDVAHLRDVVATLRSVFPHVAAFVVEDSSFLLVASKSRLSLDERISSRIASAPRLRALLADYQLDTSADVLATLELDETGASRFAQGGRMLVDDRPELEYALSRIPHQQALTHADLDRALRRVPWISRSTQAHLPTHLRSTLPLYRLSRLEARRVGIARVSDCVPGLATTPDERRLLEGGIAEMLGDVATALARYDASSHPEAASRADALRVVDGRPDEALRVAHGRSAVPDEATSLLRAALTVADDAELAFALSVDERSGRDASGTYRSLATAFVRGGCIAALGVSVDATAVDPASLDRLQRCAVTAGDERRAAALERDAALFRRAEAELWFERGRTALDGGNLPLAIRFFRRTLASWPAHREAVERAAEALCSLDRCPDARPLVRAGVEALRFSHGQDAELRKAAARLGVALDP